MRTALIGLVFALLARPASAGLIPFDLDVAGDGLATLDTETGLYWLDLSETSDLSVDAIRGGAGGWISSGWRFATSAEAHSLIFSVAEYFCEFDNGDPDVHRCQSEAAAESFLGLFGVLVDAPIGRLSIGWVDLPGNETGYVGARITASFAGLFYDLYYPSGDASHGPAYGVMLVTTVIPEPSTLLLLAIGLAALAITRRFHGASTGA